MMMMMIGKPMNDEDDDDDDDDDDNVDNANLIMAVELWRDNGPAAVKPVRRYKLVADAW